MEEMEEMEEMEDFFNDLHKKDINVVYQEEFCGKDSVFFCFLTLISENYLRQTDKKFMHYKFIDQLKNMNIETTYDIDNCTPSQLIEIMCELFNINVTLILPDKIYYIHDNLDNYNVHIVKYYNTYYLGKIIS